MNYYIPNNSIIDDVVYENNGKFYELFIERTKGVFCKSDEIDLKDYTLDQLSPITDLEEIEAFDKYMNPYEDNKPKIYMAGPLFNEGDRYTNQVNSDILKEKGFTTFLPQEIVITNNSSYLVKRACFYMDFKAIKECDYLLANCNGIDIDSGTAAEIGLAFGLNKKMILYKSDVRNYYNQQFKLNNFVGGLVDNKVCSSIEEVLNILLSN